MVQLLMIPLIAALCLQDGPTAVRNPGDPDPPQPPPDLLAGPTMTPAEEARPLTLVQRSFDGVLEDIGPEPDVVAIGMLPLTEEQRARSEEILSQRTLAFDRAVRGNYGLIVELASLQGQTDPRARLEVLQKLRTAFEDYIQRGSFLDEMTPHLQPEQRQAVEHMLKEYREAKMQELRRGGNQELRPQQLAMRARLEAFGQMIRLSIERQVGLEREQFELLAEELELTAEQRAKAEAIFQPLAIARFQDKATARDRAEAVKHFNAILTPAQRAKLLGFLVRQWTPPADDQAPVEGAVGKPMTSDPPPEAAPTGP